MTGPPHERRRSHAVIPVIPMQVCTGTTIGQKTRYPWGLPVNLVNPVEKGDYSPAGVGGFGRGGRGAAGLTDVDDAGFAAGRTAGRADVRTGGLATLKDLIFR